MNGEKLKVGNVIYVFILLALTALLRNEGIDGMELPYIYFNSDQGSYQIPMRMSIAPNKLQALQEFCLSIIRSICKQKTARCIGYAV